MIIDCHAHWAIDWEKRYHGDATHWLEDMDRHGVTASVLMGQLNMVRQDLSAQDNDTLTKIGHEFPKRILPLATTWPQLGDAAISEVMRCVEKLKVTGLKFHPWRQGFSLTDPIFAKICGLAGELQKPVFLHDGTPCYSLPEQVGALAERFPKTTFVLGHTGLLWAWRSAIEAARRPNVWVCLCGPHMRGMEAVCEHVAPERIVWGSDRSTGFTDVIEYRLNSFLRSNVPDNLRSQILSDNPCRLLNFHP